MANLKNRIKSCRRAAARIVSGIEIVRQFLMEGPLGRILNIILMFTKPSFKFLVCNDTLTYHLLFLIINDHIQI